MDKEMMSKIPHCGEWPEFGDGQIIVGAKQLRKAVNAGRARYVFLAENADPAITGPIEQLCQQQGVGVAWVPSMAELGRSCGIEVGAAAAAWCALSDSTGILP